MRSSPRITAIMVNLIITVMIKKHMFGGRFEVDIKDSWVDWNPESRTACPALASCSLMRTMPAYGTELHVRMRPSALMINPVSQRTGVLHGFAACCGRLDAGQTSSKASE